MRRPVLSNGTSAMTRVPLLLRSAPAQGTGSYAGLPADLDSTPGSSDVDDARNSGVRKWLKGTRKGKSVLRQSHFGGNESSSETENDRSAPASGGRSSGRRKSSRQWSANGDDNSDEHVAEIFHDTVEGQQESGLETRFTSIVGSGAVMDTYSSAGSSSRSSLLGNSKGLRDETLTDPQKPRNRDTDEDPPDNSPYPQVRASVAPTDDTTLSINTPRMWTFSILFAVLGSSTNLFFSLRYPSVSITPVIALLLVHPLGLIWDRLLKRADDPVELFQNGSLLARDDLRSPDQTPMRPPAHLSAYPSRTQGVRLWLAQGHWNAKEHCCVFIASNVSFGFAFATDVGAPTQGTLTSTQTNRQRRS